MMKVAIRWGILDMIHWKILKTYWTHISECLDVSQQPNSWDIFVWSIWKGSTCPILIHCEFSSLINISTFIFHYIYIYFFFLRRRWVMSNHLDGQSSFASSTSWTSSIGIVGDILWGDSPENRRVHGVERRIILKYIPHAEEPSF